MDANRRFGFKVVASVLALGVGFLLMSLTGLKDRDFKPVSIVRFQPNMNGNSVESISSAKTVPVGFAGEFGVDMTGKIHDGYLELRIKRESENETRIIPMAHLYDVTFVEPR